MPLEQSLTYFLSLLELWRGDWQRASSWAAGLAEMVEQSGTNYYKGWALTARGMADAHLGRLDQALAAGNEALDIAISTERQAEARQLLGFTALSAANLEGAAEQFGIADEILQGMGQREPAQHRFHADFVEALTGLGELDKAQQQVNRLTGRARVFPRPWTLAMRARSQGLLLAAQGDPHAAAAAMREALTRHERLDMPFERARTLLAHGQILRRCNERRQARIMLEQAVSAFDKLGAQRWAGQARAEARRLPASRARTGQTGTRLTATEERIAQLAAAGLTNLQIASRAFISQKTVEANLSRVYTKLGIRSRAQLALALSKRPGQNPQGPDA